MRFACCSELRMILVLLRLPSNRQYGVLPEHGVCWYFSELKLIIIVFLIVSGLYALVPKATITQLW